VRKTLGALPIISSMELSLLWSLENLTKGTTVIKISGTGCNINLYITCNSGR
jgi:hypothetical protein